MPKGMALRVHCDFCGAIFSPARWNCRTCSQSAAEGRPDQSLLTWAEYERAAKAVSAERRPERKAAADRANFARLSVPPGKRIQPPAKQAVAKTPLC